jgi:hypothetical protein
VTVLIDVPDQPSNPNQSRRRSATTLTTPPGLAATPSTCTGRGSGPRTTSATPVTRPIQSGLPAIVTGNRRPATTGTAIVLSLFGATSVRHRKRTSALSAKCAASHATTG